MVGWLVGNRPRRPWSDQGLRPKWVPRKRGSLKSGRVTFSLTGVFIANRKSSPDHVAPIHFTPPPLPLLPYAPLLRRIAAGACGGATCAGIVYSSALGLLFVILVATIAAWIASLHLNLTLALPYLASLSTGVLKTSSSN